MEGDKTPPESSESTEMGVLKASPPPERVGPYRILQKIGEGGMGEVYLAKQEQPIRRRVALKLIKLGMDTKAVIGRFETERQALAIMNHPNVAKVFDAGATDEGRPFFAMEYIKGEPITKYCDKHRLTTTERLRLFVPVCEGVQHAHQKGIIHRDIKPSNVLVSIEGNNPAPKIIDFGVARASEYRLTEKTVFTQLGVLIGTPEYMSPEQAEMTQEDIDTRTDVYSLGVLLYELLVGALPFDPRMLRRGSFDEIRRRIREDEPSKPSTRLMTLGTASTESARRRRTDLRTLQRQLSGDLDWITMRALEKDRARRYGSPSELAAEIRRHLRSEPVLAGPPVATYRAKKFLKRHRVGASLAGTGLLALTIFAVTVTVQVRRTARERDRATRVSEFLTETLQEMDPQRLGSLLRSDLLERVEELRLDDAPGSGAQTGLAALDLAIRRLNTTDSALRLIDEEILRRAEHRIESDLTTDPLLSAQLHHTIGVTQVRLGLYERAQLSLAAAAESRRHLLGPEHPETLSTMHQLAVACRFRGDYDEAVRLLLDVLDARTRILGTDHAATLRSAYDLAHAHTDQGRFDEAESLLLRTLEAQQRVLGRDHADTLMSQSRLAAVYDSQGRLEEAESHYVKALDAQKRTLGADHEDTLGSMINLAELYRESSRFAEAETLYLEALRIQEDKYGEDHPFTAASLHNLGCVLRDTGRHEEARPLFERVQPIWEARLGSRHPAVAENLEQHAKLLRRMGDETAAERLEARAAAIRDNR